MTDDAVVADIGGTHARFGTVDNSGQLSNANVLTCDQFSGLQEAYKFYIENHKIQPKRLAAAVACPVEHDQITLTNNQWGFSKSQLLADLCLEEALIINDFTAQSLAVVSLSPSSFETLNTGIPNLQEPIFVIGPGTGLGVGGLVLDADGEWTPLSTEGGHVTLAAQTEDEWDVLRILKSRFSHISAERVISGPGLLLLYQTLCTLHAKQPIADSTATMIAAVDQDPMIYRALEMFAGFFGGVASDGCLTLGSTQGVYIAGGVIPKLGPLFRRDLFMQRFLAKGRFNNYLSRVPVKLLLDSQGGLSGLARALETPSLKRFSVRTD